MDITPIVPSQKQVITGYGNGVFKVSGQVYSGSVMVFPDHVIGWDIKPNVAIGLSHLQPIIAAPDDIELLLIGCPKAQSVLPANIRQALKAQGISLEIMDTGAAVRTYNVLLAEGRKVAAALVAV